MSIRINWVNNNITFTDIKIYRAEKKLEGSALPSPLTTLTTGTTYLDTTSLPDTVYWYAVSVNNGVDTVISYLAPTCQPSVLGPGPSELLRGDAMCGYYGPVSQDLLFTNIVLGRLLGMPVIYNIATNYWDKFIFRGKILYYPQLHLSTSVSWTQLYSLGLIYGVDGPGKPFTQTPVNQNTIVSKGNFDFRVRSMRTNNSKDFSYVAINQPDFNVSEVSMLQRGIYFGATLPNEGIYGLNSYPGTAFTNGSSTIRMTYMESNGTSCISTTAGGLYTFTEQAIGTAIAWRPVLELVQPERS